MNMCESWNMFASSPPNWDLMFRIIVLGDADVGKSCLVRAFVEGNYKAVESTVGVDFFFKVLPLVCAPCDWSVKLQIWDTAGAERFRAITHSYYRNTAGVLLAFDLTSRPSFKGVPAWVQQVHTHTGNPHVTIVLVGTKADVGEGRRAVSSEEALTLAQQLKMQYVEVSAKEMINIQRAFSLLSSAIYQKYERGLFSHNSDTSGITSNQHSDSFSTTANFSYRNLVHKLYSHHPADTRSSAACCASSRTASPKLI